MKILSLSYTFAQTSGCAPWVAGAVFDVAPVLLLSSADGPISGSDEPSAREVISSIGERIE